MTLNQSELLRAVQVAVLAIVSGNTNDATATVNSDGTRSVASGHGCVSAILSADGKQAVVTINLE